MDDNWNEYQEEVRRHYLRRKLVWAFLLALFTLALLAVAPKGSPYHRDNNRVAAGLAQGWDNLKTAFTEPDAIAGVDTENNQVTPEDGDTDEGESQNGESSSGSGPAVAYPVDDSFSVGLPDNATSLTVDVKGGEGTQVDLMVDGQELGSAMMGDNGDFVWTPNPEAPPEVRPAPVEQTLEIVMPSVIDQIDASMPLFVAGKTQSSSVVFVKIDGDKVADIASDVDGNWQAELDLKALKPGGHIISAETLINNEVLPNTPSFEFDLKEAVVDLPPQESLFELIMADEELTTLTNAVETAGLQNALIGDEDLTVFAPVDSAFAALPKPILDAFGSNLIALNELLLNHVASGSIAETDLSDPLQSLGGAMIKVDKVDSAIEAENGQLYKISQVLLPPPAITPPIIDITGVETFSGNFLTVVGTAEPNSSLLLLLNGEKFGEAIVSPEGTWGIGGDIADGSYEIVAYSYTDELELAVSETVTLEVEN